MSVPIPFPDPARGDEAVRSWQRDGVRAVVAALAVAAGTMPFGVLAGLGWAAVAPRPLLVMTAPGAAALVNTETDAFIAADAAFCLVCVAGGVISGVLAYLFAVRKHGPLAMTGLLAGALAAAFVARWVGEHFGLATFQHLLATLPVGTGRSGVPAWGSDLPGTPLAMRPCWPGGATPRSPGGLRPRSFVTGPWPCWPGGAIPRSPGWPAAPFVRHGAGAVLAGVGETRWQVLSACGRVRG